MNSPKVWVVSVTLLAVFLVAGGATAGVQSRTMTTAIRAVGYPKPHPKTLTCKGATAFQCKAVYRHHRVKRFAATWQGQGGWICAGARVSTCKLLRHGFATTAQVTANTAQGVAELAAVGYMQNVYDVQIPNRYGPCTQNATISWTCGYYVTDTSVAMVTVSLKNVRGGVLISGSSTVQPTG